MTRAVWPLPELRAAPWSAIGIVALTHRAARRTDSHRVDASHRAGGTAVLNGAESGGESMRSVQGRVQGHGNVWVQGQVQGWLQGQVQGWSREGLKVSQGVGSRCGSTSGTQEPVLGLSLQQGLSRWLLDHDFKLLSWL